jgi:hypothetical protein
MPSNVENLEEGVTFPVGSNMKEGWSEILK